MKCLSIRQPWTWLIVRPDLTGAARSQALEQGIIKTVENRSRRFNYRGALLLHASQGITRVEYEDAQDALRWGEGMGIELPPLKELQRGGIVGICDLVGCTPPQERKEDAFWHVPGQFGLVLENIKPVEFVQCKGTLGLFDVPWPQ